MTRAKGKTLAVWTPSLDEVNGQNLVTRRVVQRQVAQIARVYAYPAGGGRAIPRAILSAIRLCLATFLKRHDGIYLVCSRSTLGLLRDAPPLAMSLFGHRVIVHVHGSDFPGLFRRRFIGPLARLLYRNCDVIVPSSHLVPLLGGIRFRHLEVCENFALSSTALKDIQGAGRLSDASFVVLWNSNLMSSKGIKELVDGLRLLRDEGFAIRLVVLGTAIGDIEATKDQMSAFVASLASVDWIDVKGRISPEEVADHLEVCDAVALPSTYPSECQPLAIVQAMLAGRIVLVASTDALHATVGNYPALFVDRNARSIADALRPYAAGTVSTCENLQREISLARERFAPESFDTRIRQVLCKNRNESIHS